MKPAFSKPALKQRLVGLGLLILLLTILVPWAFQVPDKLQLQLDPTLPAAPTVVWQKPESPISTALHEQTLQDIARVHVGQTNLTTVADRDAPLQAFALKLADYTTSAEAETARQHLNDAGYRAFVRERAGHFTLLLGPDVMPEKLEEAVKQLNADKRFAFVGISLETYVP